MDEPPAAFAAVPSLASRRAQVPDPRGRRGRQHPWTALLLVAAAVLCGANSQRTRTRWGQHHGGRRLRALGFTHRRAPSQPTIQRVLGRVEVATVERLLGQWLQRSTPRWVDGIAIDGKTLRRARRLEPPTPIC